MPSPPSATGTRRRRSTSGRRARRPAAQRLRHLGGGQRPLELVAGDDRTRISGPVRSSRARRARRASAACAGLLPGSFRARARARSPISPIGSRTVVRPGRESPAMATSSKPVTEIWPGTAIPADRSSERQPMAMSSFSAMIAVTSGWSASTVRAHVPTAVAGERVLDDRHVRRGRRARPRAPPGRLEAVGDGGQPEGSGGDGDAPVPERQHVLGDSAAAFGVVGSTASAPRWCRPITATRPPD